MAKRIVVSVSIDADLAKRIDDHAAALNQTRSAFCERLLADGLADEADAVRALQNPVIAQALMSAFGDRRVLKEIASVIGDELSDQQLTLFQRGMLQLSEMSQKPPAKLGAVPPKRLPAEPVTKRKPRAKAKSKPKRKGPAS